MKITKPNYIYIIKSAEQCGKRPKHKLQKIKRKKEPPQQQNDEHEKLVSFIPRVPAHPETHGHRHTQGDFATIESDCYAHIHYYYLSLLSISLVSFN